MTRSLSKRCPRCGHPIRIRIWPVVDGAIYPLAFYDVRDVKKPEIERCPGCGVWLYNLEIASQMTGLDLNGISLVSSMHADQ